MKRKLIDAHVSVHQRIPVVQNCPFVPHPSTLARLQISAYVTSHPFLVQVVVSEVVVSLGLKHNNLCMRNAHKRVYGCGRCSDATPGFIVTGRHLSWSVEIHIAETQCGLG